VIWDTCHLVFSASNDGITPSRFWTCERTGVTAPADEDRTLVVPGFSSSARATGTSAGSGTWLNLANTMDDAYCGVSPVVDDVVVAGFCDGGSCDGGEVPGSGSGRSGFVRWKRRGEWEWGLWPTERRVSSAYCIIMSSDAAVEVAEGRVADSKPTIRLTGGAMVLAVVAVGVPAVFG
jgi:hypothetical protein